MHGDLVSDQFNIFRSVWSRAISENQPRENTSGGTTYEHSSRLYASSVASGAGVSSSGAEAASELDEIDVLTPRRSFNRLIKGCVIRLASDGDTIDLVSLCLAEHTCFQSSEL